MVHIVIGIVAIVIGVWGVMANWYMFKDIVAGLLPFVIICFGLVALLAGIRSIKAKWQNEDVEKE